MRRRAALLAGLLVLLAPAPARAFVAFSVDSTMSRGHLIAFAFADPSFDHLELAERVAGAERLIASMPLDQHGDSAEHGPVDFARLDDFAIWKCDRRSRTFVATLSGPDGVTAHQAYSVRTPSCANRLELRVRPGSVRLVDTFGLGGVGARVCGGGRCRRAVVGTSGVRVELPVRRGDQVRVGTRWQHEVVRVGARPRGGPVVLATGDSLVANLQVVLADRLGRAARVVPDAKPASGLTNDPLYGSWLDIARAQVARFHPRATVVFLGTNDVFGIDGVACCGPDWGAAYERRARAAMEIYAQGGAGSVIWLTVPYDRDRRRHPAEAAVDAALRRAAATVPGVAIVGADDLFTPGGAYRAKIGGVRVREDDGIHLSLAGSRIAARAVVATLRTLGVL